MSFASPAAYASPSSDQVAREPTTSQASAPGKPRPHPCTACKKSKVKCDEKRPICDRCTRREYRVSPRLNRIRGGPKLRQCEYPSQPSSPNSRIRRFHRRSRNGCETCKSRRVRCDEAKPVCSNCQTRETEVSIDMSSEALPDVLGSASTKTSGKSGVKAVARQRGRRDVLHPSIRLASNTDNSPGIPSVLRAIAPLPVRDPLLEHHTYRLPCSCGGSETLIQEC